jgi:hypothetical protein
MNQLLVGVDHRSAGEWHFHVVFLGTIRIPSTKRFPAVDMELV